MLSIELEAWQGAVILIGKGPNVEYDNEMDQLGKDRVDNSWSAG